MRLIIRCPVRPVAYSPEDWSSQDLYFSWAQSTDDHFKQVLDLDALPVAESVLAIIPGIDVRLTALKVPTVSNKKIIQLLPMLIEDELLSPLSETSIQLLPPMPNQSPELRLVSVIHRDWLLWLSQKLAVINCEKIQLIPEGMLLPISDVAVYFQQEDTTNFYTSKKSTTDIISWSQPLFTANGITYFITANEGDDRDDFLASGQKETARVGSNSIVLSNTAFPNAIDLKKDTELGRLNVFSTMGKNTSGQYDKLYTLGGRSFSIYNASTGAQVYDSGNEIERLAYSTMPVALLGKAQVLERLDNKGPEPESVVVGQVNQKNYAFVALERSSAIMMYDLTNPAAPKFIQWLQNTTDLTNGDISPEGLSFVPASQSPTGQALLIAGHEVSGTVSVWEIK